MRTGAGTARIPSSSDPSAASGAAPSPPHPLFAAAPDGGGFDLGAIVAEFESSGFVVLLDVFGSEAREALSGDLRTLVELQSVGNVLGGAWPEDIPSSDRSAENLPPLFHPGHGGATMPRCAPWLTRDLIANPAWEAVVAQVIGAGAALVSTSGNTAFPPGQRHAVPPRGLHLVPQIRRRRRGSRPAVAAPDDEHRRQLLDGRSKRCQRRHGGLAGEPQRSELVPPRSLRQQPDQQPRAAGDGVPRRGRGSACDLSSDPADSAVRRGAHP